MANGTPGAEVSRAAGRARPRDGADRRKAPSPARKAALETELASLRRKALLANPLVAGQRIVFVVHAQYPAPYHAIDTLSQVGEATEGNQPPGGAMKVLDAATGKTTTLVDCPKGTVRDPCMSFDGKTILFAMRHNMKENFHIFEVRADGGGLRNSPAPRA